MVFGNYTARRAVTYYTLGHKRRRRDKSRFNRRVTAIARRAAIGVAPVHWINNTASGGNSYNSATGLTTIQNVPTIDTWKCNSARTGGMKASLDNNAGNFLPMRDHAITQGDGIHNYEGNEIYLLGYKYNMLLKPGPGATSQRSYLVRIMHGWFQNEIDNEVPSIDHLISRDASLPSAASTISSLISNYDARGDIMFPWALSSEDTNLQKRQKYKILGDHTYTIRDSTTAQDKREVALKFYFKVNRKIKFENQESDEASWTPWIIFYCDAYTEEASQNPSPPAAAHVHLLWESRCYWKNI